MTTLVFVDTETTSLRPDRRAWDIALIVRRPGQKDVEYQWLIDVDDLDLGNADPFALRIGHFYERHPAYNGGASGGATTPEMLALPDIEELTRDAYLVGCVPNFDAEVLGARMRAHGIPSCWHHHLVDVENLAAGHMGVPPPWDSEALSQALGVPVPGDEDRHTAIGDARWARDMYDAVMGTEKKEIN